MSAPRCPRCNGHFRCTDCDYLLSKPPEVAKANIPAGERAGSEISPAPFPTEWVLGPRGGAIIDFGNMIRLETWLFFADAETDSVLPWIPMPLDGQVIHDCGQSRRERCEDGTCGCGAPTGWRLTRPILRALLGKSDAFLNEHGRHLPGKLPCWCLCVDTLTFMRDAYFDPDFRFPTRRESRAARSREPMARAGRDVPARRK
jgi:hypothetical protein